MFTRLKQRSLLAGLLAFGLLVQGAAAAAKSPTKRHYTAPLGLSQVQVPGFHHSYVRKEADLATPRPVCVSSGELTLAGDWPRQAYGKSLRASDLEKIRTDFNHAVRMEFEKAFRDQGGYKLASSDTDCALRLVVSVQDLYLNAPEAFSAVSAKTYARSVGRLRMQVDVLDGSGSILLARAHGDRTDPEDTWNAFPNEIFNETNRITEIDNIDFARDAARDFAEYTRTRLLKKY
jgi:hypothetical protein